MGRNHGNPHPSLAGTPPPTTVPDRYLADGPMILEIRLLPHYRGSLRCLQFSHGLSDCDLTVGVIM